MSEPLRLTVEALAHWILGWTLVVLGVAVWLRVARPRRAAVRYGGWLLATFAGVALAPVVLAVGPLASWREMLRALPSWPSAAKPSEPAAAFQSWFDGKPTFVRPSSFKGRAEEALDPNDAGTTAESPGLTVSARTETRGSSSWNPWLQLVVGLWAAGVVLFAARLAWSVLRIRALLAGANSILPVGLRAELESARQELGIRRGVRVVVHPEIAAPMCVGLFRPAILWPEPANCPMSPRERLASLTHELAHLRHGDDAVALLAEVWRALAWFYPPVHLTVARLRSEREYRCDDLAAAKLDAPEQYAKWLLDLAPVRVGPSAPFLAASLLGKTSLADRVERIVRGEARWTAPLGRRARAMLALAALAMLGAAGSVRLVGFGASAAAQEPADAPLPEITPAQLAAKIREAMGRYDDKGLIRVVFADTREMNHRFMMNQGKPEEQTPILVSFRGRARHESDGARWRLEYDSMMPSVGSTQLWPDRWSAGFDGERYYNWQVSRNQFILGDRAPSARQWTPRSIIWEKSEDLFQMLEAADRGKVSISITQRVVDGVRCYVLEDEGPVNREWGSETVISPSQGFLPVARKWTTRGKPNSLHTLKGVHEVVPGVWAPERIEDESFVVPQAGPSRLMWRRRLQVVEYRPRRIPPVAAFRLKIPYGIDVVDLPQGSSYHNDPWWPEIGPMFKDRFDWPRPNFSRLASLGSSPERKLDGQPAPPLRIANWLDSKPIDLASLRGKVVLIEFGGIEDFYGPEYAPALRQLYAVYHPAGLEILSIQPPAQNADEVRRFARDFRLPYPVVIDEGKPGTLGVTAEAFAIGARIRALLIDHEGKVHSAGESTINGGRVVETLVSLLQKAGARDVKPVSLEIPRLPQEAFKEADTLFQTMAKKALDANPSGKIACRIVDGTGQPVAGASVQATLQLTTLLFATPGGYSVINYHRPAGPFSSVTGADGRFEIPSLCKGAYLVRVSAPGKAWSERKAFLGADLEPASIEFVLHQGDSIAGRVLDELGQPIAGATVTPTARQHYEGDVLQYVTASMLDGVTTDDDGRFRFAGIQEGRYPIEVKAAGFKDRALDPIPAGKGNVEAMLERLP